MLRGSALAKVDEKGRLKLPASFRAALVPRFGQEFFVTSLRGESVTLDEFHRQVLRLLDGTRTRDALAEALLAMCRRGELILHREGADKAPVRDEAEMRALLGPALGKALDNLAKKALLATRA